MPAKKSVPRKAAKKSAQKATSPKKSAKPGAKTSAKTATKSAPKKSPAKGKPAAASDGDAKEIDARLRDTKDWRNVTLARVRALIREEAPEVVERVQWRKPGNATLGVPTWSHNGLLCTGETYKDKVKFTFAQGAALEDPTGLFNAADTGATRRAIDLYEGDGVDGVAFKQLVRAAVELNEA